MTFSTYSPPTFGTSQTSQTNQTTDEVPFNPDQFVQDVMAISNLGEIDPIMRRKLEEEIAKRLIDRITITVVNTFEEAEFNKLEKLLKEHPEMPEVDAVGIVAEDVPGLKEILAIAIQDLFDEFAENAEEIEAFLNTKQQNAATVNQEKTLKQPVI